MAKKTITIDELIPYNFDDALVDVLEHRHTHYLFKGGRGSGKSTFISIAIVLLLTIPENKDMHAIVFRKTGNTLRDSVYYQVQTAVAMLGLTNEFQFYVNPMRAVYKRTGQTIVFRGVDDKMKLKSLKAPFGYFAITWLEETDTFHGMEEIRNIIQSCMRGGSKFWIFMSYNPPISRSNFMNKEAERYREDRLVHSSDYRTVPVKWLSEDFVNEALHLKEVNPRAYEHEYLGIPVGTGGEVFDNLEIREIPDSEVASFDNIFMGIDWGWYPDPFHWSKVHYDGNRKILYVFDELRCWKTSNAETWNLLVMQKGVTGEDLIIADSAENKSIGDYRDYGALCRPAVKGPDSRRYSYKWLQSLRKIVIDPKRCPYTAKEFSGYEYERNKDDEIMSGYPDKDDHSMDAIRYSTYRLWKRKGQ